MTTTHALLFQEAISNERIAFSVEKVLPSIIAIYERTEWDQIFNYLFEMENKQGTFSHIPS